MISVAEARAIALDCVSAMPSEEVALADALGRTLAEAIVARRAQPPFAASAMDGYAVRSADTPGRLRVIGEAGAGRALTRPLAEGECARIFTGAPVPPGADCVLIQEDAVREGDVVIAPKVETGRHVRQAGMDFRAGARLLEPSTVLDGARASIAAAAGQAEMMVARRPIITTLSGGDEIVPPGSTPGPDQIFDCASHGVAGLAANWGAEAHLSPPLPDDRARIAAAMETALATSNLVVMIGGASVGDHDHARAAAESIGGRVMFSAVSLRPGKPTWVAVRGDRVILGLPGNPSSALVCARLFLRPLIDKMLGRDPLESCALRASRLSAALDANGARETYLRAASEIDASGQFWVKAASNQDSSLIGVFKSADMLILRTPHQAASIEGEVVQTLAM
jgi:molybdopterin molybdotransferase